MEQRQDFRAQRSESPEGRGYARATWNAFHQALPGDLLVEDLGQTTSIEDYPKDILDDIAEWVVEESELIGFWIAWHRAGGFANLQAGGWNRATIFRRLRAFRTRYGAHPDEYRFEWIMLDLPKAWDASLRRRLTQSDEPPASHER